MRCCYPEKGAEVGWGRARVSLTLILVPPLKSSLFGLEGYKFNFNDSRRRGGVHRAECLDTLIFIISEAVNLNASGL